MKRYSLLTLFLLTTLLSASASAFVVDEFEFTIIDAETNSVSVKRNKAHDYSRIDSLTIPKTVIYNAQTYNVTEIGFEGFRDLRADRGFPLKKIILPEGLKVIGGKAFVGLYDIKDTTIIPSTVDTIGDYAFADWVTPIQFLSEVPAALGGTQVFRDAKKRNSSVIIPCRTYEAYKKVKNWNIWLSRIVDPCLFSDGTYTYQVLPEDDSKVAVKALVDNSIQHVTFSTNVTNPDNDQTYLVAKIADNCFKDNATITSVTLPPSLISIGASAFYNCKNLQTISLNDGLEFIGEKAFAHDSLVTGTLTIPSSVTSIGTSAFYNFSKIEKIDVLPQMPPAIGASIFTALAPQVSIWIPCNTYDLYAKAWKAYESIFVDQCLFSDGTYTYQVLPEDNSKVAVKALVDNSIQHVTFSTNVTNPDNDQTYLVAKIADNCFKDNATITSVTLPPSLISIGASAFYNCKNLQTISLNDGLEFIGEKAFAHDSLVTGTLTIPSSVTSIGTSAFYNFSKIEKIDVLPQMPPAIGASIFTALAPQVSIWIPCNTYDLYAKAWKAYESIFVDQCLFSDGTYTYQVLPEDDSKVAVKSLVNNEIQNISFNEEVTNPYNKQTYVVSTIADSCFMNNATITSVVLPNSIVSIGKFAFFNCKKLQSISLNEGLKTIGARSFAHDSLVTGTLTIPSSVSLIETRAFYNFLKIEKIEVLAETPPAIDSLVFSALPNNATIIIPCGFLNLYQNANYWKDLSSKFVSACKPLTLKKGEELTQEDTIVSSIAYRRTFDMDVWQTLYLPFEVDSVLVYDDGDAEYYNINYPFKPGYGGYFYLNKYDTTNVEEATITFSTDTTLKGFTHYLIQFPTTDGYFVGKDIIFKSKAGEYPLKRSDYIQPTASSQFQVWGNSSVYNQSVSDMYIFRATKVPASNGSDSVKYEFNQQSSSTLRPFDFGLLPYVEKPNIVSAPKRMSLRIGRSSGNTGGGDITTSVSETHAPNAITYRTGAGELALSLNGLPCQLYSVSGTMLYSSAGGTEEITIPLEKGIYILYSEGKSQKIVL